jgi:ribosome-associated protein
MISTKSKELSFVIETLEDIKSQDIINLPVEHLTEIMSNIIITTATSKQHCQAVARHLIESAKEKNIDIIGIEGLNEKEWILVDFGDIVVHIMLENIRSFYELEKLWGISKVN